MKASNLNVVILFGLLASSFTTSASAQLFNGAGIPDPNSRPTQNTPFLLDQNEVESKASGFSRWLERKGAEKPLLQSSERPNWLNLGLFKRKDNGFDGSKAKQLFSAPGLFPERDPNRPSLWQDLSSKSKNLFNRPESDSEGGFMAALKRSNENFKQRFANLGQGLKDSDNGFGTGLGNGFGSGLEQDKNAVRDNIMRAAQDFQSKGKNLLQNQPPLRSAENLDRELKKRF